MLTDRYPYKADDWVWYRSRMCRVVKVTGTRYVIRTIPRYEYPPGRQCKTWYDEDRFTVAPQSLRPFGQGNPPVLNNPDDRPIELPCPWVVTA